MRKPVAIARHTKLFEHALSTCGDKAVEVRSALSDAVIGIVLTV
jgi:hypothetical protein